MLAAGTSIQNLDIAMPDGTCDARLATPNSGEKCPGVLFCMDAFGLRPVIDDWIQRIAARGYVVLAPNLLYRSARSPIVEDVAASMASEDRSVLFQRLMPMMKLLTPENVARDAKAYAAALRAQPQTAEGSLGATGYCMGARFVLRAAAACPGDFAAAAGFHGGNLATQEPDSPHLLAGQMKAEVYIAFADHDEGASPEQQARLDTALTEAGLRHQVEVYKDAPHGYTMADTPAYRKDAAERHFDRLIELLGRNLKRANQPDRLASAPLD